jgi:Uma2 family endonuclease
MMFVQKEMTPQEFLRYAQGHPDKRFDFVDGEMVEVTPQPVHGRIQAAFTTGLTLYTDENPIGVVYTEVLHVLDGKKFIPDVCINIPTDENFITVPPIIVVEIRSPDQSKKSQREKIMDYVKRGVKMGVLVIPGESVEVHRAGQKPKILSYGDTLEGDDVLPGFTIAVDKLL